MADGKKEVRANQPVWENAVERMVFEPLRANVKCDVLIIGGGLAGILCAHLLEEKGIDCILVEAERICGGVNGHTTAKLTYQHGLIYDRLIREFGAERAKMYLEANREALEAYRKICAGIDCDFEEKDQTVYSLQGKEKIENEMNALERLGVAADIMDRLSIPVSVDAAIRIPGQAQFHPLKFAFNLAKKMKIYENTRVLGIENGKAITQLGEIQAKKIIIATHFPFLNKHGFYFLKLFQHRSYVIALENTENVREMIVDEADAGMSFRMYQDMLLLGGGGHRTGKKGGGWEEIRRFYRRRYPGARERFCWATQDCMTLDRVPYIGQYGRFTPNLYVITGFNKWGMTGAMAGAMMLRDQILGLDNPWSEMFTPWRRMLRPQLAVNGAESFLNLITPTAPRCPHMGCALKYNPQEHSWDCPCHGSRFSERGKVLENPANRNKGE